jgi:N-methylhydantoinase A
VNSIRSARIFQNKAPGPHAFIARLAGQIRSIITEGTITDMNMSPLSLGIDIGGTFTDLVILDPRDGRASIWKESTTPDNPSRGAVQGLKRLLETTGIEASSIGRVIHATTLFTNALIERKGVPTGLLTTAGFADVIEIGRERKYELYDLFLDMPKPLVKRSWRREVDERLDNMGNVVRPLQIDAVLRAAEDLVGDGIESLAIAFLHSYANPAHEQQAAEAIAKRFPKLSLSLSSDIAPEIREYPRVVTTVANAYVQPIAETYLDQLEASLREVGVSGTLFLMLSNGGLTHVAEAKRAPVQLLESGPAAGALAGVWFGRNAGLDRVLAFDMGGTTAKLALIDDGEPMVAWGFEAARQKRFLRGSGLPIQIATVELIEIGAGGGSIAQKSSLGTLHVGPESAGAAPGPACYGRGGLQPTVTDSDLTLGYLNADFFLGGTMQIDAVSADGAMAGLAQDLGLDVTRSAYGIHDIVNENMAGAARVAIAERGRVSQDYALLATGGAGPVHAWQVGRKLGVGHVVCPPGAGAGSTIGMLKAPARIDRVTSFNVEIKKTDWAAMNDAFDAMEAGALAIIEATGADIVNRTTRRLADMRYVGQGSEITVAIPADLNAIAVREAFESAYRILYGRTPPGAAVQFVALRLSLVAPMPGSDSPLRLVTKATGSLEIKGRRRVYFQDTNDYVDTPVYDRYAVAPGTRIDGPAIFEENESTFVVGPDSKIEILTDGTILVEMPK